MSEITDLIADVDDLAAERKAKTGAKQTAWKAVMMGLRNYVRPMTALPPWKELLPTLQALQLSYLMTDAQIRKYLLNDRVEAPGYGHIQATICAYLQEWRASKRKKLQDRLTLDDFRKAQRKVLLNVAELRGNVWNWWHRQ